MSEPPPGVEISVFLYKLQDQNLKLKNSESIKERGLRYREIKLDDDLILNYQALNELGQKLLQDKPRYLINVSSLRYNLAPLGLSIPFNVNNLYQNNVILQENRFNFSHIDENKKPVFMQNIVFSNLVSDPNKYIAALKRQTANNRKIKKAERELRNENIFIQENILYNFFGFAGDLIALAAQNITAISFKARWYHINLAYKYVVQVSNFSNFSSVLFSQDILYVGIIGNEINLTINTSSHSGPFYYRVLAFSSDLSTLLKTSNIIEVPNIIQFPTSITGAWGTKTLTYDYIFNPQSIGDFTNYGSISGTIPYLDRRSSGDNYPTWINESGIFGLDFSNSPYGGLRVPSNNFSSNPNKITIIVLGRITQSSPSPFFIASNINNNSGINGLSLSTDTPMNIYLVARNGNSTDRYFSDNSTAIFTTSDCMFTFSVDLTNNTKDFVKNQSTISTTEDIDQINFLGDPSIDMVIGSNWQFATWGGGDTKLIIKKIAILNDKLTDAQIKKIHEIMGF